MGQAADDPPDACARPHRECGHGALSFVERRAASDYGVTVTDLQATVLACADGFTKKDGVVTCT
jgi:hypothetical protein